METQAEPSTVRGHAVFCGYRRVGRIVGEMLTRRGFRFVVIEQDYRTVQELRTQKIHALCGDAANPLLLEHAHLAQARVLVVAFDDPSSTRAVVDRARKIHPRIAIVARAHGRDDWQHLREHGVDDVVLGEIELAAEVARFTLNRFGVSGTETQAIIQGIRLRSNEGPQ